MSSSDLADTLSGAFSGVHPFGVISAYLFGRHATGTAHRESDVDVGVLLDWEAFPDAAARFDERVRLGAVLVGALHCNDVDLVILNDAPPQLARHVLTTGRRVFCRDPEADHAFLRTTLSRAADLEPFLRRTRRVKLAAIKR
jgi:predicted nucleotidyltransferase